MKSFAQRARQIAALLNLPADAVSSEFRVVLYGGEKIIVENHGGILSYRATGIRLRVPQGTLTILGDGLLLAEMDGGTVIATGRIHSISADEGDARYG